jgi:glycine cleavage system H lipoate-binding protein
MPPTEHPDTAPFWIDELAGDPPRARLGLTQDFIESLSPADRPPEIVGLELLPVGARLLPGDSFGLLQFPDRSVDLRAPFALTILDRNQRAIADPRLVAVSPYDQGWLIEFRRD